MRLPLCRQLEVVRKRIREPETSINSSDETARRYAYLEKYDRERLIRVDLDGQNRVIGQEIVSIGTINSTRVSPREVFKGAILNNATRIILVHNHPSGQVKPSDEDEEVNEVLREAGKLLAILVVDFVIIGESGRYWSAVGGAGCVYLKTAAEQCSILKKISGGAGHETSFRCVPARHSAAPAGGDYGGRARQLQISRRLVRLHRLGQERSGSPPSAPESSSDLASNESIGRSS